MCNETRIICTYSMKKNRLFYSYSTQSSAVCDAAPVAVSTCMHTVLLMRVVGTRKMGRICSLSGVEIRGVHVHPRDSEMKFYFTASTPLRHCQSWRSEKVVRRGLK